MTSATVAEATTTATENDKTPTYTSLNDDNTEFLDDNQQESTALSDHGKQTS